VSSRQNPDYGLPPAPPEAARSVANLAYFSMKRSEFIDQTAQMRGLVV
jgi:hypothetical protein